jgi:hypothetical protein
LYQVFVAGLCLDEEWILAVAGDINGLCRVFVASVDDQGVLFCHDC